MCHRAVSVGAVVRLFSFVRQELNGAAEQRGRVFGGPPVTSGSSVPERVEKPADDSTARACVLLRQSTSGRAAPDGNFWRSHENDYHQKYETGLKRKPVVSEAGSGTLKLAFNLVGLLGHSWISLRFRPADAGTLSRRSEISAALPRKYAGASLLHHGNIG